MNGRFLLQFLSISTIFVIALVLEIMPWASGFQSLKPAWLVLALSYWILALPNTINVGTAFVLGIIWDLVIGSILGVHGLVLSVFAYFFARYHQIFRNLSLWQQSLLIMIFVSAIRIGIFILELSLHSASFDGAVLLGAVISGVLWSWVFLLLRPIQRKLGLL